MFKSHADKVSDLKAHYPNLHESTLSVVVWFEYEHLDPQRQEVSRRFSEMAHSLCEVANDRPRDHVVGPELTTALRKLLEAKDCAVRGIQ